MTKKSLKAISNKGYSQSGPKFQSRCRPREAPTERLVQLETDITARLPEVDVTDVLIEVDTLTGFSDHFEHLNSVDQGRSKDLLLHL